LNKTIILLVSFFLAACGGSSSSEPSEKPLMPLVYKGATQEASFNTLNNAQKQDIVQTAVLAAEQAISFSKLPDGDKRAAAYSAASAGWLAYAANLSTVIPKLKIGGCSASWDVLKLDTYANTKGLYVADLKDACFYHSNSDISGAHIQMSANGKLIMDNNKRSFLPVNGTVTKLSDGNISRVPQLTYLLNGTQDTIGQVFKCGSENCQMTYLAAKNPDFLPSAALSENGSGYDLLDHSKMGCQINCNDKGAGPFTAGHNRVYDNALGHFILTGSDLLACDDGGFYSGSMQLRAKNVTLEATFHTCGADPLISVRAGR